MARHDGQSWTSRHQSSCSSRLPVTLSDSESSPSLLNNGQTARPSTSVQQAVGHRRTTPTPTDVLEVGWRLAVVLAAFVVHCIVDGVSYSFAVFYVDLLTEFSTHSHAKLVLVGTLLPATCLFIGPVVGGLTHKYGCRPVTVCGSVLAAVSVVVSSFCPQVNMLIATYGLLAGVGFGMMRLPSIVIVSFYFSRRRALATSVVLCGSGVGKLVFPPLSRYLIDKYGWRGANCIVAAIILHGAVCGCVFRPVRHPLTRSERRPRPASPRLTGCVMMQKIIVEKRRRRHDSTGSLDGTVITSDGRLLRHNNTTTQPVSRRQPRTVSDPASTDSTVIRTFSTSSGQHNAPDQPGPSAAVSGLSTVRTRTVSDPVSTATSSRTLPRCTDGGRRVRRHSSTDRLSSATALQTVSPDNCDSPRTSCDHVTVVPDVEVVGEQSSTQSQSSDANAVVWVVDSSASATFNSGRTELSETEHCSQLIEMTDLTQHRRPSSIRRPPSTTCRPPSVSAPLSSRPDVFSSASCLQANSEASNGGQDVSVTSSDDRKWSSAHADGGPVWTTLRFILDVTLLHRVTFVMLAVSVLLCYFGLLTAFTYIVDHAMLLGVSKTKAAVLLSVLGGSSGVSRLLVGWIADAPSVDSVVLYTVALLVAGASTCSLPSLRSYQLLCGYQLVYGICCAVFITLKSILVVDLLGLDKLATAYGILSLLEGVGSLAGTPLIGGLYDTTQSYTTSFIVAGSLLILAGLVSVPLRRVERWEHWRHKRRRTVQQQPLANIVRNNI